MPKIPSSNGQTVTSCRDILSQISKVKMCLNKTVPEFATKINFSAPKFATVLGVRINNKFVIG